MQKFPVICMLIVGLTAGTGAFSTVQAQPQEDERSVAERVEGLSEEGFALFAEERFEEAIAKFETAYEIQAVPNLLFNIGRCYEQLDDWDQAIHHYEEFIRSPDVDSEARDQAMDRVQSLREIRRAEEDSEEYDEAELEDQQLAETSREDIDDVQEVSKPNLIPAYAALGAGGALVVGGALTGLAARGNAEQAQDGQLDYSQRLDAQSSARTQGYLADGLFVAGGLSLAAGVYLLMTSSEAAGDDEPLGLDTLGPWFDGEYAGVGISFGF